MFFSRHICQPSKSPVFGLFQMFLPNMPMRNSQLKKKTELKVKELQQKGMFYSHVLSTKKMVQSIFIVA